MIVESAGRYVTVLEPPTAVASGWTVRVKDYRDYTTIIAYVDEFLELNISCELSAVGAGSVTIDVDSPFWSRMRHDLPNHLNLTLLDREYLWEALEDGVVRGQWLGRNIEQKILDSDETRVCTVSGPGPAAVLQFAVIHRPGWPLPVPAGLKPDEAGSGDNRTPGFFWEFKPDFPAMRMWMTLFRVAQARGAVPWINPTFTEFTDSAGQPWEYVPTVASVSNIGYKPTPGQNLLDFLNECTAQDTSQYFAMPAEWVMWPGLVLECRKQIANDRSQDVVFFEGGTRVKSLTRARGDIANHIVVVDVNGDTTVASDAQSRDWWNLREQLQDRNKNVTDAGRRNAMAQIFLEQAKDELAEWVIQVPYDLPNRKPWQHYRVGDYIGISTYRDNAVSTTSRFRVLAMTINIDSVGEVTVELTLQSLIEQRRVNLERELTRLLKAPTADTFLDELPTVPSYLIVNPDGSYYYSPFGPTDTDVNEFNNRVWIQEDDPAGQARVGDFWYDLSRPDYIDHIDGNLNFPDELDEFIGPIADLGDHTERIRVPGTNIQFE